MTYDNKIYDINKHYGGTDKKQIKLICNNS